MTPTNQLLAFEAFSTEVLSRDEAPNFPLVPIFRDALLAAARNRRMLPGDDWPPLVSECVYPLGASNRALVNALYFDLLEGRPLPHVGLIRFLTAASRAVIELVKEVANCDFQVEVPNDCVMGIPLERLARGQSLARACEAPAEVLQRLQAFEDFEAASPDTEEGTMYLLFVYGGRVIEELESYFDQSGDDIEGRIAVFAERLHNLCDSVC
jgi:hypothetical protein